MSRSYLALITRIAAAVPQCGIGADVIVGYPAEDQEAFVNTCRLVEELPITYLHVFAYSKREGTSACRFGPEVDAGVKRERSRLVRELGRRKSETFRRSLVGATLGVLILRSRADGHPTGLSGNYVRVALDREASPNTIVAARVTGVTRSGVSAEIV